MKSTLQHLLRGRGLAAILLAIVGLVLVAPAAPALGQATNPADKDKGPLRPPTPVKPDTPPATWNYVTLALIGAAVIGASLIPSKRGHQD